MTRHFLNLSDAGGDAIAAMINDAMERKSARAGWPQGRADADQPLKDRVLAMVFEKNSTRTRVSFDYHGDQPTLADGLYVLQDHWLGLVLFINHPR